MTPEREKRMGKISSFIVGFLLIPVILFLILLFDFAMHHSALYTSIAIVLVWSVGLGLTLAYTNSQTDEDEEGRNK